MSQADILTTPVEPQERPAARSTLISAVAADSLGQGLLISTTTFYMIRVVGLSASEVGVGLTVAAILGILVSGPIGYVADRWNPLVLTVIATVLQGVAVVAYTFIQGMASYLAATVLYASTFAGALVTGAAMLPTIVPAAHRVRMRATTRVTSNIGISFGVALGGLAVGLGSRTVYHLLFGLTAVGLLLSAYFFSRLRRFQVPVEATEPAGAAPSAAEAPAATSAATVLKDKPYLTITILSALLAIHDGLLTVALPLWISKSLHAPAWIYSVAIGVNTVAVVLLQIPFSRSSDTAKGAGRALRLSGLALAVACLLWAGAGQTHTEWLAVGFLLAGSLAHVVGEITSSAGGWGLSYELAPEGAHGKYQGVFGTGQQMTNAIVPVLAGVFLLKAGMAGWMVVGGVLLVAGLFAPAAVSWALRTPPRGTA
jgi:MFS family permease